MQLYGVPLAEAETDRLMFNRRLDLAHSAATLLDKNNLLKYDRRTGNLQVLPQPPLCPTPVRAASVGAADRPNCFHYTCLDLSAAFARDSHPCA